MGTTCHLGSTSGGGREAVCTPVDPDGGSSGFAVYKMGPLVHFLSFHHPFRMGLCPALPALPTGDWGSLLSSDVFGKALPSAYNQDAPGFSVDPFPGSLRRE